MELNEFLLTNIHWNRTTPEADYKATLAGKEVRITLNDFPTEQAYTLIYNEIIVGSFDDWPSTWSRTTGS
ncbi:hypothetical protein [Pseudomonas entomophila]|uniref:Uncharacterized protein n=2 Tax=Pseudomonas entomophila TaxID=312306 RepID=Q1IAJ0_PSEE4|nr:hypothetical protein [Pseudomonas entomophila]WMW03905.1 hypothetical protein RAH46_16365 [Pseudomonas entomophila]CAK15329.1 hypothetical protein PSEEN2525 [Pseudomonas entomophila L48]